MLVSRNSLIRVERLRRYYHELQPTLQKPKMRATTTAVFSFLAVSLFAWYAVRPTAQTITYLRREIADKVTLNQKMEDKITALIEAQSTHEEFQDRLGLIEQALPQNPEPVYLARQLQNLAFYSQASVSAIQISTLPLIAGESTPGAKLAPAKTVEAFPVTLLLSGEYPQVKAFLEGLINLRRTLTIETVSIKPESTGGRGGPLRLYVRLMAHYATPP